MKPEGESAFLPQALQVSLWWEKFIGLISTTTTSLNLTQSYFPDIYFNLLQIYEPAMVPANKCT